MMEKVVIGNAELWHGDCLDLLSSLQADAVISDPPYGMGWNTSSRRFTGGETPEQRGRGKNWPPVYGDQEAFNPEPWLDYPQVVLFGSNHYAASLPTGTTLVWLKRLRFGSFLSDAEIAWMKGGHGVYCHQDASMNGAGANFPKLHPTQKPVGLMAWCIDKAGVPEGATVLDPYMGSGTTGVAALQMGLRFIGVEHVREYFDIACERLADVQVQGRLAI